MLGDCLLSRHHPWRIGQPVADLGKDEPVVPAKALTATNGLEEKQGKKIPLGERTPTGSKSTIVAVIDVSEGGIAGTTHTLHLRQG